MKFHPFENLYITTPLSPERVEELNIRSIVAEDGTKIYKCSFPVYYWIKEDGTKIATLYAHLAIYTDDNSVRLDIRTLMGSLYAYYYNTPAKDITKEDHPILYAIYRKIELKLKDLGIKRKKKENVNYDRRRVQKEGKPSQRPKSRTESVQERRSGKRNNRPGKPNRKVLQKDKQRRSQDGVS